MASDGRRWLPVELHLRDAGVSYGLKRVLERREVTPLWYFSSEDMRVGMKVAGGAESKK